MATQRNTVHDDLHEAHGEAAETQLVACPRGYRSDGSSDFKGGILVEVNREDLEEGSTGGQSNSDTQGSYESKGRRGRKRAHPEESQEDRKRRVKETRKAINRKYYEKSREPEIPKKKERMAESQADVKSGSVRC